VFISQDFKLTGKPDHEIENASFFFIEDLPDNVSLGSKNRIEDFSHGERKRYGIW